MGADIGGSHICAAVVDIEKYTILEDTFISEHVVNKQSKTGIIGQWSEVFNKVLDKVKKFKNLHTHFSGIEFTDKGERRHLPISSNHPNFKELGKELVKNGFTSKERNITIICESPVLEQDSLRMKKILEKLKV